MRNKGALILFRRELQALFFSPAAYIVITLFLLTAGWFFFSAYFLVQRADMRDFFSLLPSILGFTIPALTMRLFAEEYRSGSYEVLMTLPLKRHEAVLGKFLAALALVLIMLAPTAVYALSVSLTGELDWGPVAGGYLGAAFLAAAFTAVGLCASALTRNQIVAFILAAAVNFFLILIDKILFLVPPFLRPPAQYLGADFHFRSIAKGVIDSRDLIYFLSITFGALYLSNLVHGDKR